MTVNEKTRLVGHFRENEVLAELINVKTAVKKSENKTALSQKDLILLSFQKFDFSKK